MNVYQQRIAALRQLMQKHQIDAWIIPTADPHLSEYLPQHWQSREWFSGFTGSAGTLVITQNEAALWADSRYWEQAEKQLSHTSIILKKIGQDIHYIEYLKEKLKQGNQIGMAADMLSIAEQERLNHAFTPHQIHLQTSHDLLDVVWQNRPNKPAQNIYPHLAQYVDLSTSEKLALIRQSMAQHQADYHLISSLDDIAWICNLRGHDVEFNPIFLSYLLIGVEQTQLFVQSSCLESTARQQLIDAQIQIEEYEALPDWIQTLSGTLLINKEKTAVQTLQKLPENVHIIDSINPSTLIKSCKTPKEIKHIKEAMLQDGIALCHFFAELEAKLAQGQAINELDIDHLLIHHRSQRPHYISPSFDTIAGFNANGAMAHYRATPESFSWLNTDGLLLIDSGAQYQNGTTDITRVIPIGTATPAQKRDFTLVLKAHIALAQTVFPAGTPAPILDSICRAPLWQEHCDFGHGTGHGVGYFLNVHEGPQSIAYRAQPSPHHVMKIGMLTSNEPGLYRAGKWGIRIENLILCQAVPSEKETDFGTFLQFETLTLCPIDTRLIQTDLLTPQEKNWLNQYHQDVYQKLAPHLNGNVQDWLKHRTQAI